MWGERKEGQDQIILMLNEKLKSWESTIGKSVAWDQASQLGLWSEKEHAFQKKKKKKEEQSEPSRELGEGRGGGAWRHAFCATDP